MDNMINILFVCIALPLVLSSFLLDKKSRMIVIYMVIGAFMCMFISYVNGIILAANGYDYFKVTTVFTPISEEIIKALPVLLYAYGVSDRRDTLLSVSMATGIGFAILENANILVTSVDKPSILWAVTRVFGASLMHGICTAAVGYGISFVYKRRKLFYTGTFALLTTAIIYHGIFNALLQSAYPFIAYVLPVLTYIPIVISLGRKKNEGEQLTL